MMDGQPVAGFFVATYEDVSAAEADFHAVGDVYRRLDRTEQVDAVVLGKKMTGEARIYEGVLRPTRTYRMAAGVVVALFPAEQTGSATWRAVDEAVSSALAGHIAAGRSRTELKDLGNHLDRCHAAMIAAARSADEAP